MRTASRVCRWHVPGMAGEMEPFGVVQRLQAAPFFVREPRPAFHPLRHQSGSGMRHRLDAPTKENRSSVSQPAPCGALVPPSGLNTGPQSLAPKLAYSWTGAFGTAYAFIGAALHRKSPKAAGPMLRLFSAQHTERPCLPSFAVEAAISSGLLLWPGGLLAKE